MHVLLDEPVCIAYSPWIHIQVLAWIRRGRADWHIRVHRGAVEQQGTLFALERWIAEPSAMCLPTSHG